MALMSLVIVPFLLAFSVFSIVFAYLVQRTSWTRLGKMFAFSFWVAVFSFPQFVPFIVPIPLPNIVPVAFGLFTGELFSLYTKTTEYTAIAYVGTFMLAFALSPLIFVPQHVADTTAPHPRSQRMLCVRQWLSRLLWVAGVILITLSMLFVLIDLVVVRNVSSLIFVVPLIALGAMACWMARLIKRADNQEQE